MPATVRYPARARATIRCMRRSRTVLLLAVILLAGFFLRAGALQWNWFMHGDVIDDTSATVAVYRDKTLNTLSGPDIADPAVYPLPPPEEGEPLVQHAPLWPVLGGGVMVLLRADPTMADAFFALRILSVIAGMLIIVLSFFLASRLMGGMAGLAAAAFVALSYVLIDYSGNGAFYSLQAVLYLAWALAGLSPPTWRRTALLGVIAGIAYLVNFQSIILLPAGILLCLLQVRPWRSMAMHAAAFAGLAILTASPWLVRSALVFGDPLHSHSWNMDYVYVKAGLAGDTSIGFPEKLSILGGVLRSWLPNNLYYAARKLFVLAPLAFFLFSFGLIDVTFSRERFRKLLPVLLVLTFHVLISASWPIWKFRYFVPMLPFVFILALEQLWHLPVSRVWRGAAVACTVASLLVTGYLTYRATPTHTTYYDGALTQDPFHGSEEAGYLLRFNVLPPDHAP